MWEVINLLVWIQDWRMSEAAISNKMLGWPLWYIYVGPGVVMGKQYVLTLQHKLQKSKYSKIIVFQRTCSGPCCYPSQNVKSTKGFSSQKTTATIFPSKNTILNFLSLRNVMFQWMLLGFRFTVMDSGSIPQLLNQEALISCTESVQKNHCQLFPWNRKVESDT